MVAGFRAIVAVSDVSVVVTMRVVGLVLVESAVVVVCVVPFMCGCVLSLLFVLWLLALLLLFMLAL